MRGEEDAAVAVAELAVFGELWGNLGDGEVVAGGKRREFAVVCGSRVFRRRS
jgi:hypothetical protein